MSTTATATTAIGLFPLCLQSEPSKLPGAPNFKISVLVNAVTHQVTGQVEITQSVAPPAGHLTIQVTGSYSPLLGGPGHMMSLSGHYAVPCPPPALCIIEENFIASIFIDDKGNAKGNFHWGKQSDNSVVLKTVDCFGK